MKRDERRLLVFFTLLTGALLVLRGWVARTLAAEEEKVNLAFLDLLLRT